MFSVLTRKWRTAANIYARRGPGGLLQHLRRRLCGNDAGYLDSLPPEFARAGMAEKFSYLADSHRWDSSGESASGHGSAIQATEVYRAELIELLQKLEVRSIFDAPCGDFNWMSKVIYNCSVEYVGGDIVKRLVEENRARHPQLRFVVFDVTRDLMPDVDVWHCRDCLFHLSYSDISKALTNFQRSNIRYALLTSDQGSGFKNIDIITGDFRYLDLTQRPLSFPQPRMWLQDYGDAFPRAVGLWERDALAEATARLAKYSRRED